MMAAILRSRAVGPWPMNTYVVTCDETNRCAIVDPGADLDDILALTNGAQIEKILLTHAHGDHVGALDELKARTNVPVYLHPLEKARFGVDFDIALDDGQTVSVGTVALQTVHTPGHTPGMISFVIDHRVVVGDTIFVDGPGRTQTPADFATTMQTLQTIVFRWPDATQFFPGHGPSGQIGRERPAFEAFVERGWSPDLCGDVLWHHSTSDG